MEINFRNKQIIAELDKVTADFLAEPDIRDYKRYRVKESDPSNIKYCEEPYLRQCLANSDQHVGFPEHSTAFSIRDMAVINPTRYRKYDRTIRDDLVKKIGSHSNALTSYYPPNGYVSWHTNWNANAYQLLISWSETGDGFFSYYDNETDKVVTLQDKPGWQARWFYFGLKSEPMHHCWHAAWTNCQRFTFAYKFGANRGMEHSQFEGARMMRDAAIEELESE